MENKTIKPDSIKELILRGINLMKLVEPGFNEFSGADDILKELGYKYDCDYMCDVRDEYRIWRLDIKDYLQTNNIDQLTSSFFGSPILFR